MALKVAVMFGGRSVEHEVSVISGIQALMSMDEKRYDAFPVYISKDGTMYVGDAVGDIEAYKNVDALIAKSTRVIMVCEEGRYFFVQYPAKRFGKGLSLEVDVVLPVVHGTNVEDGALQGYLRTIGVPFGGCDVTASAVGMDKRIQKEVLKAEGIPVLDCISFTSSDYADVDAIVARCEAEVGYPLIVKPVNLGSSVGIGVAADRDELIERIDDAFLYAGRILVEHAVTNLREINCSVVGDEEEAEASVCEEPLHSAEILSYEDKYLSGGGTKGAKGAKGGTQSAGMASVSRKIPAELPEGMAKRIQDISLRAFKALGCSGVVRIDYILDGDTGEVYFNEINTIPGSLAFYLWEATGLSYPDLLDRLVQLALRRKRREAAITFAFDTNLLSSGAFSGSKGAKGSKR